MASGANVSKAVRQSFNNACIIVTAGWAIHPADYFLGQLHDSAGTAEALNVTYNVADFGVQHLPFHFRLNDSISQAVQTLGSLAPSQLVHL